VQRTARRAQLSERLLLRFVQDEQAPRNVILLYSRRFLGTMPSRRNDVGVCFIIHSLDVPRTSRPKRLFACI
jgi:hypothetical protein